MAGPLDLFVGDVVELRKAHPCGGTTWRILRVGLDIGIECTTCKRYVLVPRRRFERGIKRFIKRGAAEMSSDSETLDVSLKQTLTRAKEE